MRTFITTIVWLLFMLPALGTDPRPVPEYGRPEPASDPVADVANTVLFPARVATEYGFRQPLRWLGRTAELNDLPFQIADFFKFGEEKQFALYPSVLVDFGFLSSGGFRFRWKNFLRENNRLSIRAATGGTNYGILRVSDDLTLGKDNNFAIAAEISKRPDFIFHSTGPMASKDDRFRYGAVAKLIEAHASTRDPVGGKVTFSMGVKELTFSDGNCCNEPGIDSAIASGIFPAPSRYPAGYTEVAHTLLYNRGGRVSRPKELMGVTFDAKIHHSFDLQGGGWFIYGGALSGYRDLTGRSRVLSLRVETELSQPHGGTTVPFDQLPALGGTRMPGFLQRRFIDQSAYAMTLEYRWPVLSVVDGVTHFSLGNVFRKDLDGLQWGWLRKSIGIGFETTGADSSPVSFLVAFGSEPFDLGGEFNEFRFSISIGGGGI